MEPIYPLIIQSLNMIKSGDGRRKTGDGRRKTGDGRPKKNVIRLVRQYAMEAETRNPPLDTIPKKLWDHSGTEPITSNINRKKCHKK